MGGSGCTASAHGAFFLWPVLTFWLASLFPLGRSELPKGDIPGVWPCKCPPWEKNPNSPRFLKGDKHCSPWHISCVSAQGRHFPFVPLGKFRVFQPKGTSHVRLGRSPVFRANAPKGDIFSCSGQMSPLGEQRFKTRSPGVNMLIAPITMRRHTTT